MTLNLDAAVFDDYEPSFEAKQAAERLGKLPFRELMRLAETIDEYLMEVVGKTYEGESADFAQAVLWWADRVMSTEHSRILAAEDEYDA